MIPPDAQRAMSKRAGSHVVEVKGSHAVYVSQPQAVASLIEHGRQGRGRGGVLGPSTHSIAYGLRMLLTEIAALDQVLEAHARCAGRRFHGYRYPLPMMRL